jgi:hypothetical protein
MSFAERRIQICNEIAEITTMRRGNFNEFYYDQKLKDGTAARRGPFYNITLKGGNGKTVSKSVKKNDVDKVRAEVENYRRFRDLTEEYIDVCEKIALLPEGGDEAKKN